MNESFSMVSDATPVGHSEMSLIQISYKFLNTTFEQSSWNVN